jgi:hypothetical protein
MLIGLICFTLGFGANAAISGDITATGKYWADQYTLFSNMVTMSNELKADRNVSFADYTGLIHKLDSFTTFSEMTGYAFDTNHNSSTATTTTDLTLTGL